jgi:hypothetical protein
MEFQTGVVYYISDQKNFGYLRCDADDNDYTFYLSKMNKKLVRPGCHVNFQLHMVPFLQHEPIAINTIRTNNYGPKDLRHAVTQNDHHTLKKMLADLGETHRQSYVMERQSSTGNTLLHYANDEKIYEILFQIFSKKKDEKQLINFIMLKNHAGETALFKAVENKNAKMVKILLNVVQTKAPEYLLDFVLQTNKKSRKPFSAALRRGDQNIINILLEFFVKNDSNCALLCVFLEVDEVGNTILDDEALTSDISIFYSVIYAFVSQKEYIGLINLFKRQNITGSTFLHNLICYKKYETLKMILKI